jgi:tetratricopeptide (TPR) repeat protein
MKRVPFVLLFCFFCAVPLLAAKEREVVLPPEKLAEALQLTRRADSLLARKYYEDAIVEYLKVLAITPRDHVAHNKLGIAYHQLQQLEPYDFVDQRGTTAADEQHEQQRKEPARSGNIRGG